MFSTVDCFNWEKTTSFLFEKISFTCSHCFSENYKTPVSSLDSQKSYPHLLQVVSCKNCKKLNALARFAEDGSVQYQLT